MRYFFMDRNSMASKKRLLHYQSIHHIYNRGVLKKDIFHYTEDYKIFTGKMIKYGRRYPIDMLAYCLMPNHFHFLIKETGKENPFIPLFMQQLQNSYAKFYATKYNHSGKLFQGTYKNKLINDEKYYWDVINYIMNNPVKNGLVSSGDKWKFKYLKGDL